MSIQSMMTDDVTIITPNYVTDSRNNKAKNWVGAAEVAEKGWMAQTNASASFDELSPNREGTLTEWRLFLRSSAIIDNRCRVRYLGDLFDVVGLPHKAKTPQGFHHIEVPLRLVVG